MSTRTRRTHILLFSCFSSPTSNWIVVFFLYFSWVLFHRISGKKEKKKFFTHKCIWLMDAHTCAYFDWHRTSQRFNRNSHHCYDDVCFTFFNFVQGTNASIIITVYENRIEMPNQKSTPIVIFLFTGYLLFEKKKKMILWIYLEILYWNKKSRKRSNLK